MYGCLKPEFVLIGVNFILMVIGRTGELQLEPFETAITTESTPFAISLATHLRAVGAKMYGAFWCSHCQEQKQVTIISLENVPPFP